MKVVVAGAGVFGACIAVALARAGTSVTVVDPAALGENASGVAAGMLAPAFESVFDHRPEHFARLLEARDLWPAFAASIGVEIYRTGALAVSFDENEIDRWSGTLNDLQVSAKPLSSAEIARLHPALSEGLRGLQIDIDWRLDARETLEALRIESERLGVSFRTAAVANFKPGRAELHDGTIAEADALVIATGASASLTRLSPELARLVPIKGHILEVAGADVGASVIRFEGGYLCPTRSGVLLGATMEVGRVDPAIDPAGVAELIGKARLYARGQNYDSVVARVGVRASTVDGWPLIGRSQTDGVWLAVGARRNGWLLAPMVARSIVEAITARSARTGSGF